MGKTMTEYTVIYESGPSSFKPGATNWSAYVPDLPGCVSVGDTREEIERNIQEAIEGHLLVMREEGMEIPEPRSEAGRVLVEAA